MKALIDTCVVCDFLQKRDPFAEPAMFLFEMMATNEIEGYITTKSIANIYYLMHRCLHSDKQTRNIINKLLDFVNLLDTTANDVINALPSSVTDYEDAILNETAIRTKMDYIVTRNTKNFTKSSMAVFSPQECLERIHVS